MSERNSLPPPAHVVKLETNDEFVEANPARSFMFTAQDPVLMTRYEILQEDHDCLKKDYAISVVRLKQIQEMNELMESFYKNQLMGPEAINQRLLKNLQTEKEEKMRIIEEIQRLEDEVRIIVEEEEEVKAEIKRKEGIYNELAATIGAVQKKCLYVKSLFGDENLIGQVENNVADDNEVIVVDEYRSLNNTVTDVIVISDDSDAEYDNPPRESSNVGVKQDEQSCNGATSSQVNHPLPSSSSSSSSSSSDEFVLVPLPVKRLG